MVLVERPYLKICLKKKYFLKNKILLDILVR